MVENRIKEYREKLNMQQVDLARAINVDRKTVGRYENRKRCPSLEIGVLMARHLRTTVEELFIVKPDCLAVHGTCAEETDSSHGEIVVEVTRTEWML